MPEDIMAGVAQTLYIISPRFRDFPRFTSPGNTPVIGTGDDSCTAISRLERCNGEAFTSLPPV